MRRQAKKRGLARSMLHTPLEQVAKHGNKVGSGQTLLRIDQATEVHV